MEWVKMLVEQQCLIHLLKVAEMVESSLILSENLMLADKRQISVDHFELELGSKYFSVVVTMYQTVVKLKMS